MLLAGRFSTSITFEGAMVDSFRSMRSKRYPNLVYGNLFVAHECINSY